MANAQRDSNFVTTGLGVSKTDGLTPTLLEIDPNTGELLVQASISGSLPLPTGTATSANQTNGSQQTKITNGTNTADVVAGDSGFNGIATAGATKTYTFTTSASGGQTLLANTPTEGFSWIEIVYTSVGSGLALTGQFASASGGTYISPGSIWTSSNGTLSALGTSVNTIYTAPVRGNFFQLVISALSSGTFTGTVTLRALPISSTAVAAQVSGSVGANSATGSAVPANAFYIGFSGVAGNLTGWPGYSLGDGSNAVPIVGMRVYNGSNSDSLRTPAIFKSVSATTSGNTAVWTPTAGKKVRLMKFKVQITSNATTTGGAVISVGLQDATTDTGLTSDAYVPSAAVTTGGGTILDTGWIDLGNGRLSAAANNVLNINLSAALATGNARIIVCGTEE